jgi:hypothetical protein
MRVFPPVPLVPLVALVLFTGCAGNGHDTTSPLDSEADSDVDSDGDSDNTGPCDPENAELEGRGPNHPVVGDIWTFFMQCDDVHLYGIYILQVEPTDFAFIKENTATFREAGVGTFTMEMGNYIASLDATVEKAK